MLAEAGAGWTIVGHSERRQDQGESDADVAAKALAAKAAGLKVILCVGESLDVRDAGDAEAVVSAQLLASLPEGAAADWLAIAYEPIWAISSAKGAKPIDPAEAADLHRFIQAEAAKIIKKKVRVIYGGSVNPGNFAAFLKRPEIGGLLVGAASLKLADFEAMC